MAFRGRFTVSSSTYLADRSCVRDFVDHAGVDVQPGTPCHPSPTLSYPRPMEVAAQELLRLLRQDRASYVKSLSQRLAMDAADVVVLGERLVHDGSCEWVGARKRRIRLTHTTRSIGQRARSEPTAIIEDGRIGIDEPPRLREVSELARRLWRSLPPDGQQVTNVSVRSRPEFSEVNGSELSLARRELRSLKLVELRSGRDGGGLRRVVGQDRATEDVESAISAEDEETRVRLERELYEPFQLWLTEELDPDSFVFTHVAVTATDRRTGKWSQPDLCQLTVTNFEYLPSATVELASFELKRATDARKLESVYEAAAHGRWATKANLVIEVGSREVDLAPEVLRDADRFGLGVYKVWFTPDGRLSAQQLLQGRPQSPDDSDLDDLIGVVLSKLSQKKRADYRQAIR